MHGGFGPKRELREALATNRGSEVSIVDRTGLPEGLRPLAQNPSPNEGMRNDRPRSDAKHPESVSGEFADGITTPAANFGERKSETADLSYSLRNLAYNKEGFSSELHDL